MRRVLILALLISLPALASAQIKISEEWTTYCDNGVKRVRVALTYELASVGFDDTHSQWMGAFTEPCAGGCGEPTSLEGELKSLGRDRYKWTWEGWSLDCLALQVWRSAMMSYFTEGEFGPENRQFFITCGDGPQTVVEGPNCTTPIATSTWGSVKALYR